MTSACVIFACTVIFLNVNYTVCSLEFHKKFEEVRLPSDASQIKLNLDALFMLFKDQSSNYMKDLMKDADHAYVWNPLAHSIMFTWPMMWHHLQSILATGPGMKRKSLIRNFVSN